MASTRDSGIDAGLNYPSLTSKISKWLNLPPRVIAGIVEYLDHVDRVSILVLCKTWSPLVAEAMYRAPPLQSSDSFERLMTLLNTPLPAHPYPEMIRELDIGSSAADNLYMGDLDATLAVCPNLEIFRLENCFHISNILVRSLSAHCPNLTQVDMPGCPITDSFIPVLAKNCRKIERLDLSFTNLTVASLQSIVMNCESLVQLDLSECREVEDDVSLDLSNKGIARPLQYLNLRNTPVSDELLRFTATHCPSLEDLVLESCLDITDDALVKVAHTCTKLRRLDVSFCDHITDLSLQAFTMRAAQMNGGALQELYMIGCDNISPGAVHNLAQKCHKLELLILDGCEQILGSYVQSFALQPSDDLECFLEGEAIKHFAAHTPGTNPTPPASPGRPGLALPSEYKVQVSYSTNFGTQPRANDSWGTYQSQSGSFNPLPTASAASNAITTASSGAQLHRSLSRRTSRAMLRKRSTMSMADAYAEAEAAKQERTEKIREKRRSRPSVDPTSAPTPVSSGMPMVEPVPAPMPPPPNGTPYTPPTTGRSSPQDINKEATSGAIPLASGRRRSQILPQMKDAPVAPTDGSGWNTSPAASGASGWGSSSSGASGWQSADAWTRPNPVPAPPRWGSPTPPASPALNVAGDLQATSGAEKQRRRSIPVPAGPPPGTNPTWSTPAGLLPPAGVTSATDNQSGASTIALAATPAPLPPSASADSSGASKSETGILLASGRSSRAASAAVTQAEEASPASSSGTGESGVLLASGRRRSRGVSVSVSTSANEFVAPKSPAVTLNTVSLPSLAGLPTPPQAPQPWGANPTIWTNPAQLTSSSSTWSTANTASPGNFVDPWARPPPGTFVPASSDPWAAPPSPNQTRPSTNNVRQAAAPGWGGQQQQQQQQQQPHQSNQWSNGPTSPYSTYTPDSQNSQSTSGFNFSNPHRGRMLLKLKIETKAGGHQTLAVHEFDDPHQLANEFCAFWEMAAFKEPLIRLISVRKTNAVRQRTHPH
ncbi:hypothetical protein DFS34DRAFT_288779 [Phlyctochytrium arcticum]|nr:hypothetical protein DFS34DRAFT_288779 [Phlyctochytrium arcticum]